MYSKLLKHEFKANAKLLSILTLIALGAGVLGTCILRILVNYGEELGTSNSIAAILSMMGLTSSLVACFVGLCVYAVAVEYIQLYRFYKSRYTDEGYLTFTLPVTTEQVFWSSFVSQLAWMIISLVVTFAMIFLILIVGTGTDTVFNWELFDGLEFVFSGLEEIMDYASQGAWVYLVFTGLSAIISPFYSLMLIMLCITLGCMLAKKHKLLMSIGVYFIVEFAVSSVSSTFTFIPSLAGTILTNNENVLLPMQAITAFILTAGITVGAYFFNIHLMKNKLNLP